MPGLDIIRNNKAMSMNSYREFGNSLLEFRFTPWPSNSRLYKNERPF